MIMKYNLQQDIVVDNVMETKQKSLQVKWMTTRIPVILLPVNPCLHTQPSTA